MEGYNGRKREWDERIVRGKPSNNNNINNIKRKTILKGKQYKKENNMKRKAI
uniref:Uncharacterized protein n=1 Tax=Arion vulgaris TaxID=1028688 RepID=A0A0B7A001_9EUPU